MKVLFFVIACLLMSCGGVLADEVLLSNARALFPAEKIKNPMMFYPLFAARLNPSGTHFIYPKMVPASPPDYETTFEIMVYDISAGKEKPIKIKPAGGYETTCRLLNLFSPDGDKLVVVKNVEGSKNRQSEFLVYDLKKDTLVSAGFKGQSYHAIFDGTGKNLLLVDRTNRSWVSYKKIALSDLKVSEMKISGMVHTPAPNSSYASVHVSRPSPGRQSGLELWDLKDEKKILELPLYKGNTWINGLQGNWLEGTKYFAYFDHGKKGDRVGGAAVRVWDVENNKQADELQDAMAVGVGPGKAMLVLAHVDGQGKHKGMFVYDVKSKESMDIGPKGAKAIHACGNKLLYVLKKDGEDMVYVADMAVGNRQ